MGIADFFRRKALPTSIISVDYITASVERTVNAYVKEGYEQNPVVFACITAIAKNAAAVKLEVHKVKDDGTKADVVAKHPVLQLLAKPNPLQSYTLFMQELMMWHRSAGEAFVLRLPEKGKPAELYLLDPRKVTVKTQGASVIAYEYGEGANKRVYPVNIVTGVSQVVHIKTPNPSDPFRGLSPMSAAARHVDIHNAGGKWNASLLANSARPSGVIEVPGTVADTTLNQLRNYFSRVWTGVNNAGKMPLLTGNAKFTAMSHNPKDMDFQNSMSDSAKNIALVYGVPLALVTMEASTFSNQESSLERYWTDTVLPLLDEVLDALTEFLLPFYGERQSLVLSYNRDSVPGIEAKRARMMDRLGKGLDGIVTINEARTELGYEADADPLADKLRIRGSLRVLEEPKEDPAKDAVDALGKALKAMGYSDAEAKAAAEADLKVA